MNGDNKWANRLLGGCIALLGWCLLTTHQTAMKADSVQTEVRVWHIERSDDVAGWHNESDVMPAQWMPCHNGDCYTVKPEGRLVYSQPVDPQKCRYQENAIYRALQQYEQGDLKGLRATLITARDYTKKGR